MAGEVRVRSLRTAGGVARRRSVGVGSSEWRGVEVERIALAFDGLVGEFNVPGGGMGCRLRGEAR